MSTRLRASPSAAAAFLAIGCAMPLEVRRVVDPAVETRGVRFRVQRPAYAASLRLDESEAECSFQLFLTQTLDGDSLEYEAIGEAHAFAATDVSLTEDARGNLTAVSAGETDKLHEAIEAAAGIAVSFLKPVSAEAGEEPMQVCSVPSVELARYVEDHRKLVARRAGAKSALETRLALVGPKTGSGVLRTISSLRDLVASLDEEIAAHRFPLGAREIHVYLGTTPIQPAAPSGQPWLKVTLTPESLP